MQAHETQTAEKATYANRLPAGKPLKRKAWKRLGLGLLLLLIAGGVWLTGLARSLDPQTHFRSLAGNALTVPLPVAPEDTEPASSDAEPPGPSNLPAERSAVQTPSPAAAAASPAPATASSSFNVVLIGTDTWGDEHARADTIMVAHVMPEKRKVNVVSIPRDTRVYVQGVGYTKINHAHIVGENKGGNRQGTLTLVQAVSDFLGIPVHQYMKTDFAGVIDFIDSMGGLDMVVEQDVTITPEITIKRGAQRLDGQHVLFLARERYTLADGDFGRQREQFRIVRAAAKQLLRPEHLPDLAGLLRTGRDDILDTSFADSDLLSLAWLFRGMEVDDFTYEQIPGKDQFGHDPLVGDEVYYWSADPGQVPSIRERLFQE